jgi:hypothetical protein
MDYMFQSTANFDLDDALIAALSMCAFEPSVLYRVFI